MSDIKDIMGLPKNGTGPVEAKEKREKEPKLQKPKGMSREAFALLSASHPLMPSQLMGEIDADSDTKKEKAKKFRGKISYEWRPFTNPSRNDDLELHHWVKCYTNTATNTKIIPSEKEYPFAKYNTHAKVLRYNDEEWKSLIEADEDWTKEETDYLLDLIEMLDMRWFVIADRYMYEKDGTCRERSVDDIKGRYYSIARQLLIGREGGTTAIANQVLVRHPFDPQHEKRRKAGLEKFLLRTPEQEAEEDSILQQAAKIDSKRKAEAGQDMKGAVGAPSAAARMQEKYIEISEFENDPPVGTLPLFDIDGNPALPLPVEGATAPARVFVRSIHTRDLVDSKMNSLAEKQRELLLRLLTGLKLNEHPRTSSRAICAAYLTLIKEGLEYIDLRKNVEAKQLLRKRLQSEDANGEIEESLKRQKL